MGRGPKGRPSSEVMVIMQIHVNLVGRMGFGVEPGGSGPYQKNIGFGPRAWVCTRGHGGVVQYISQVRATEKIA
jgi:hypothetical protein